MTSTSRSSATRGIYHKGWTAVARHANPWQGTGRSLDVDADRWELYETTTDWTQAHDLAAEHPDKLARLKRLFEIEAAKYNVLPLDTRAAERFNPELAGRPQVVNGTTQVLYGGMKRIQENAFINIKNHSHAVTAEVTIPDAGAQGVIVAQGGDFGGWSLYLHHGRPRYAYNFMGVQRTYIGGDTEIPAGVHQIRSEFEYDGGGFGKGATITLYVDGQQVAEGSVERTHGIFFSMDETADIGSHAGAPVSEDYGPRTNAFTGTVHWVQIDVDAAASDEDHRITAEERFRIAMARQ